MFAVKPLWLAAGGVVALALYSGYSGGSMKGLLPTGTSEPCVFTVNADVLNVRSGPDTNQPIIAKYQHGTEIHAQHDSQSGFRKLSEGRWAAQQYLDPVQGSPCS